jgi:transposase
MGDEALFKTYEQSQGALFPAHLSDALEASDPAFFIDEIVEAMDLRRLERRYARRGEHAYAPRMLLKLWLYAASQGVHSGREIARKVYRDLGFRYLAGEGAYPDFRTINRFRVRHQEDFAVVFRATVQLARRAGLGKLGVVAIDGSKIRANTSRHKAMSYGRMKQEERRLEREIESILAKMDEVNAEEDAEYGDDDDGGGGLPKALQAREARREKIRALREELERERGKELTEKSQKSFADPEARMMMTGDGSLQYAYNAQMAASEDGILVANGVTQQVRDTGQLLPMIEAVKRTTGRKPDWILADNGYLSEDGLKTLRKKRQRCLVAAGRENKKPTRWPKGRETQRMHRTLRLPWARRRYGKRKTQGERPFAEIKAVMGFRRFGLRGVSKVRGEWDLVCAAFNLRRLNALLEPTG